MKQNLSWVWLMCVFNETEYLFVSLRQAVYLVILFGSFILHLYLALVSCPRDRGDLIEFELEKRFSEVPGRLDCCICSM